MNIRKITFSIICLMSVFVFNGCDVSEDEYDCVSDIALRFRFMVEGQNMLAMEVTSLSVFIFDENDRFVGRWDEWDNSKFASDYFMILPLPPGIYSCVAWGGISPDYYYVCHTGQTQHQLTAPVVGQTMISQLQVGLKHETRTYAELSRQVVDNTPTMMFYGSKLNTRLDQGNNTVIIDLVKNSKNIALTILGLPGPTRANPNTRMEVFFESPDGEYLFSNNLVGGQGKLAIIPQNITGDVNSQKSDIPTLKLIFNNGNRLVIWDVENHNAFYADDILENIIRKIPYYSTQEAVDMEDEFDITIDLSSPVGAKITVNGWNVEHSGGEIQ